MSQSSPASPGTRSKAGSQRRPSRRTHVRTTVVTIPRLDSPPTPATERARLGYLPALDGLRAVAVAAVVAFHADVLPGGFIGVDVFFVISGFLITALAIAEIESTGGLRLGAFWARRARRLLPALFALVAAAIVAAAVIGSAHARPRDVVATLAYVANWTRVSDDYDYFAAYEEPSLLEHTWSLAIEEQFYLVWPLVLLGALWVARRRGISLRWTVGSVAAAFAVASTAWSWHLAARGTELMRLYFGTDTRAVGLAVGCVAACVLGRGERTGHRTVGVAADVAAIGGMLALAASTLLIDGGERWLYGPGFALIALASVALVVAASGVGAVATALAWGPLPLLGRVSYGIYLWHWPVIVVLDRERTGLDGPALGVLWLSVTALVVTASWRLVERRAPAPRRGRPALAVSYGLTAGALAVAAVVALGATRPPIDPDLLAGPAATAPVATPNDTTPADTIPADTDEPVATEPGATSAPDAPATLPAAASGPTAGEGATSGAPGTDGTADPLTVLVLGDSVAESLGEAAPRPIVVAGRPVTVVNHGIVACPVDARGRWAYDGGARTDDPPECEGDDRFDAVVRATDPDLVVLMFGWPGTIAGRELDDGRVVVACDPEHDAGWAAAHVAIAARYAEVAPVVAATVAPPQRYLDPEQSDRPACLDAALRTTGLPLVEWAEWLCPDGDCARAAGLRRDPVHFADDPEVLDLVWRTLVTRAVQASTGAGVP